MREEHNLNMDLKNVKSWQILLLGFIVSSINMWNPPVSGDGAPYLVLFLISYAFVTLL